MRASQPLQRAGQYGEVSCLEPFGVALIGAALSPLGAAALEISSPDIAPGAKIADEQVFSGFGCSGKNISPALKWSGAPAGTKSFALMVYDPDAPHRQRFLALGRGSTFPPK